jgi:hypothetical protein
LDAGIKSNDGSVGIMRAEAIKTLNQLYDARRGRFHAAISELPSTCGGISLQEP